MLAETSPEESAMAVGIRGKFEGGKREHYDAIHGHMGIEESPPAGMIFHMAGPIDGGWRVIDVWESREAFDRFFETRLGPAAQELGDRSFPVPPEIKEFPVHNFTKP
jgi:hypothetical protein